MGQDVISWRKKLNSQLEKMMMYHILVKSEQARSGLGSDCEGLSFIVMSMSVNSESPHIGASLGSPNAGWGLERSGDSLLS
jgi:hypothetical protein